jgi:hypothetical protein
MTTAAIPAEPEANSSPAAVEIPERLRADNIGVFDSIVECTARVYGLPDGQSLRDTGRDNPDPRRHCAYVARRLLNLSYPSIARGVGYKDHTSASLGIRLVEQKRNQDPEYAAQTDALVTLCERFVAVNGLTIRAVSESDLQQPTRTGVRLRIRRPPLAIAEKGVGAILSEVADAFSISPATLRAPLRHRQDDVLSRRQHVAAYVLHELGVSYKKTAYELGYKNIAGPIYACREVNLALSTDATSYVPFLQEVFDRCYVAAMRGIHVNSPTIEPVVVNPLPTEPTTLKPIATSDRVRRPRRRVSLDLEELGEYLARVDASAGPPKLALRLS